MPSTASPEASGQISDSLFSLGVWALTQPHLPGCTRNAGTSEASPTLSVWGETEAQSGPWPTLRGADCVKLCLADECPESQPGSIWKAPKLVGHQLRGASPGSGLLPGPGKGLALSGTVL